MQNLDALGRAIQFTQPWIWIEKDKTKDILKELKTCQEKLPSTSQWHRFCQNVLAAQDLGEIKKFLLERQEKASSRENWCFKFMERQFNEFLVEAFLSRVENATALRDIRGYKYFGLKIGPVPDNTDFSALRLLVVRQAFLRFIDQVILLKEKITFSISYKGSDGKVEVDL